MENLAVSCSTPDLYDKVQVKAWGSVVFSMWTAYEKDSCLNITNKHWDRTSFYEREGYQVLTAQEYLNEGGKEVSKFKGYVVPKYKDLNELKSVNYSGSHCTAPGTYCPEGSCASCLVINGEILQQYIAEQENKTQTTKENNMDLNVSIRTVFVDEDKAAYDIVEKMQNVFGDEIAEDFTGAMILRNNKEEYLAEIKRLDAIEAKRLKEAAKEG